MKKDDIKAGLVYSDGKKGVREVLSIGVDEGGKVRFRILSAKQEWSYVYGNCLKVSEIGRESSCEIDSFARWAKESMSIEEGSRRVQEIKALSTKLSNGEQEFMDSARIEAGGEITPKTLIQFDKSESRAVSGLEKKGFLVKLDGEVEVTELGAAWFRGKAREIAREFQAKWEKKGSK